MVGAWVEAAAEADAFIDDDRTFGEQGGDGLAEGARGDGAGGGFAAGAGGGGDGGGTEFVSEGGQGGGEIVLHAGEDVHFGVVWIHVSGFVRVGEEADRFLGADEDDVLDAGEGGDGLVDGVGDAVDGVTSGAALDAGIGGLGDDGGAGGGGDGVGQGEGGCAQGAVAEDDHRLFAPAEDLGDMGDGVGIGGRWDRDWQGGRWHAAVIPAGVGRQDQGGDGAWHGLGGLGCDGGV